MKKNYKPPKQSVPFLIEANPDNPMEFSLTNNAACPECRVVFPIGTVEDGDSPSLIRPGYLLACSNCGQLTELTPSYEQSSQRGEMVAVCVPEWSALNFIPSVRRGQKEMNKSPAVCEYRRKKLELN